MDHTPDAFDERYRPLETRRIEIDEELPRLEGEIDFLKIEYLSGGEIAAGVQDFYDRWPGMAPEEKRNLVETYVRRVTVGKDDISFQLYHFPVLPEIAAKWQRPGHVASSGNPRYHLPPPGKWVDGSGEDL